MSSLKFINFYNLFLNLWQFSFFCSKNTHFKRLIYLKALFVGRFKIHQITIEKVQ